MRWAFLAGRFGRVMVNDDPIRAIKAGLEIQIGDPGGAARAVRALFPVIVMKGLERDVRAEEFFGETLGAARRPPVRRDRFRESELRLVLAKHPSLYILYCMHLRLASGDFNCRAKGGGGTPRPAYWPSELLKPTNRGTFVKKSDQPRLESNTLTSRLVQGEIGCLWCNFYVVQIVFS